MTAAVVLDLPAPPSVNRTRRIDWRMAPTFRGWTRAADALVLASRCRSRNPMPRGIAGPFEVVLTFSEHHTKIDLDNGVKWTIDYLRRISVIEDDCQALMRRVVLEWGSAPEGCRVTVRPWTEAAAA